MTRTRVLASAVLALGALAVLPGCGVVENLAGGTSVFALEVGQCVDTATGEGDVSAVPVVECSGPHQGEVYALPQVPDGEFPGDAAVAQTAQEQCAGPAYTDYVGLPYEESEFEVTFLLPTADTWGTGDREIACIIQSTEPGSVRGSSR